MLQQTSKSGLNHYCQAKMNTRHLYRGIVALVGVLSLLAAPSAHATFATPGQFDVTPTGAASYTVPIAVPPGTAGMTPSLALAYNSQGGNGLLGMGWSLSGLSAITRCPKTLIQDGTKEGISYTSTDKYCLDGQRLIVIAGIYGANGAEYRTEREGFSKIVSYGAIGTTGPAWFKVWTKSGQIMEFGNTPNSAIEAQGKTAVRVWAVNKVVDTKGNYLSVTYTEDNPNGQYYPQRIDYTGNTAAGLVPYNSVRFIYATRPDITPMYDGGSLLKTTVRLTNVQTWAKVNNVDTMVKDYRLAYDVSAATQRSRLTSLTECDGAATSTCLQPTIMQLALSSTIPFGSTSQNFGNPDALGWSWDAGSHNIVPGDFNGDGKTDVFLQAVSSGYGNALFLANANGTFGAPAQSFSNPDSLGWNWHAGSHNIITGDFNGDGKTDVFLQAVSAGYSNALFLANANGTFGAPAQSFSNPDSLGWNWHAGSHNIITGDFNGDGKTDVFLQAVSNGYGNALFLANANGTFGAPAQNFGNPDSLGWSWDATAHRIITGDFNGDGKTDVFLQAVSAGYSNALFLANANGTFGAPSQSFGNPDSLGWNWHAGSHNLITGDFNGDGKTDIFLQAVNTGYDNALFLANANGTFGAPSQAFSNPDSLGWNWYATAHRIIAGDFNGDGKTDVFLQAASSGYGNAEFISFLGLPAFDLLATITNGLGATTSITYKPLTDATVYTKETTAVYPYLDIQSPLYVVSSVASSNGVGGNYTSNYSYVGAKSHLTGGGFMGFHTTTSTDAQTGIKSTTTYRQDYPYQGLPLSAVKKTAGNVMLNAVTNTWAFGTNAAWSAQYHVPKLTQSVESSYELTGTLISTVTTCNTYDGYGNPTYIAVWTANISCAAPPAKTGYHVKETTNSYTNDIVNWYLGRLTNATVTSTTP